MREINAWILDLLTSFMVKPVVRVEERGLRNFLVRG
jgi:hypothetical protein